MADTATLNVRMDAATKDAFIAFCEDVGMSASSLMNVFAKAVVRDQEVPFAVTTRPHGASARFARLFPASTAELESMLAASEAAPLSECAPMGEAARSVRERMGR